jgi:hypothetical protein
VFVVTTAVATVLSILKLIGLLASSISWVAILVFWLAGPFILSWGIAICFWVSAVLFFLLAGIPLDELNDLLGRFHR